MTQKNFRFEILKDKKQIYIERTYAAPRALVWDAWTKAEILDEWWAPRPYHCITKSLDFREGGRWLYHMAGPEGDIHWCLFDYEKIEPQKFFSGSDAFCNAQGEVNDTKPKVKWEIHFEDIKGGTQVKITLSFASLPDLEQLLAMGFREGFTLGLSNLENYCARAIPARVAVYLNFPGNCEEAFLFYRSVFKSEFTEFMRFGDMPPHEGAPPLSENLKKQMMHIALPIFGGNVLMGSDAPHEMGFTVHFGNNVHISLAPETKSEAEQLFNALAEGGKITMPLQDMFWGAYYGALTDRFGVQWMVNCRQIQQ